MFQFFVYFLFIFFFVADSELGIWITTECQYVPNRRGGFNLIFNGYLYTSERRYNNTVNWVCNKNSNVNLRCPARCVTSGQNSIKLSKKLHNHRPVYDKYFFDRPTNKY